ncbi:MAG TPA: hypothetical protein VMQ62_10640, partial [Dongiaceae bacterium]|nr:hypothetical protein [Dongiaceae bacterium]
AVAVETTAPPQILFWSPDSAFVGYAAAGKLWKVPAGGGASSAVADLHGLAGGGGGSWCPDGNILFASGEGGIVRVAAMGGDLTPHIPLDEATESDLHDPFCLPDNSVLFAPHLTDGRPSRLVLWDKGKRKEILALAADQDIWFPAFDPAGYILFHRHPANAGIWALPFSLASHEVTGPAFLVAPDGDVPSVSNDGTLVHVKGRQSRRTQLVWLDRKGATVGTIGEPQAQWPFPQLSPDGRSVAIAAAENEETDIYIFDTERGTRTRLQAGKVPYSIEAWSLDGKRLLYSEGTSNAQTLKLRPADGSGAAVEMGIGWSPSYSPDGRYLAFARYGKTTNWDLFYRDTRGDSEPVTLVATAADEGWPRISPDGRYLAYTSDETGDNYEVYLRRFPDGEGKWQVSKDGGMWARWSPKGDRLYYVRGDDIMEVEVASGPEPRLSAPRLVLSRKPLGWPLIQGWAPGFDVSPDGSRFLVVQSSESDELLSGIIVHENWRRGFAK